MRHAEPATVTGVQYAIIKDRGDETGAMLTLTLADGPHRGTAFRVEWPHISADGFTEFIVDAARFNTAALRRWAVARAPPRPPDPPARAARDLRARLPFGPGGRPPPAARLQPPSGGA